MNRTILFFAFLLALTPAQGGEWIASPSGSLPPIQAGAKAPDGLPDGHVATSAGGDIQQAWYTAPTKRYAHGILGDAIEAGALVIRLANGSRHRVDLPAAEVFEDRTPRIVDLGKNGSNQVLTILSGARGGGSIAVFAMKDNRLTRIAQTPYIGRANRWLNIAGVADFSGDGVLQIADIRTPHIGGTLRFWSWRSGKLTLDSELYGFSNHAIGSREQGLSAVADFNGDGVADLAVPGADRRMLKLVSLTKGNKPQVEVLAEVSLRAPVETAINVTRDARGPVLTLGLEDGSTWAIHRK